MDAGQELIVILKYCFYTKPGCLNTEWHISLFKKKCVSYFCKFLSIEW